MNSVSKEAYAFALQNALTEIKKICPDVRTSFIFDKEAAVVAGDAETPETTFGKVVKSLGGIMDKADVIGGLDSLIVEGTESSVQISCVDDVYLTMIVSNKADMKYVETVGRVLIPTVLKFLNNLSPTPITQLPPSHTLLKPRKEKLHEEVEEEIEEEGVEEEEMEEEENKEEETEPNPPQLELPSNQLIVESFGGLLVRSDTVQISKGIMSQWEETLDGQNINLVEIEAFNGQSSQCKVKTVNDSKLENKAVIRIPEKICQVLDVKKGELVRVKPVIN